MHTSTETSRVRESSVVRGHLLIFQRAVVQSPRPSPGPGGFNAFYALLASTDIALMQTYTIKIIKFKTISIVTHL